ncbi:MULTISPECIES: thioredoxin family protein [unclassified Pseudomonas]|uniref:thioredoxin family protein n=1 Tax=unclassified Pseudomonas TaxID=196821 RepID=UPI000C86BAC2|nr:MULTISPECIES: thioredoxin family protein [unclassified Pseudomonas]PMU22954.1 glutaredoxin [Pseudomonas sp. GP01-A9]PMU28536.1 glutaredoxin [Pseudomonas sp. GP01-A13]PMU38788.1 glutaredoxin [Pseudomonas sp. GP01-A8]PMU52406.1 glutaredoxin [Pseudomonas sp. GP01-A6]PMU54403.1 glutaredoxin [Pseudomonas sp. GP01-A14]
MKIEVFYADGCGNCSASRRDLKDTVLAAFPGGAVWSEIDIVKNIDYAVELGVLTVPAVAIDGALVFTRLPTAQQLVSELTARAGKLNGH